jgi:RimJ/RimL family protein N-acetyltransferase
VLAVERQADGQLVGEVSLTWRSSTSQQAEIGYIIAPTAQRQGFATEAARALLAFGFQEAEFHRIYARCDARNEASTLVMRRLGMHQEAHFMEHRFNKGRWEQEMVWAILAEDWYGRADATKL